MEHSTYSLFTFCFEFSDFFRFSVICFPTRTFFTRERVIVLIAISCLAASGMVTYSQILSPCCRYVWTAINDFSADGVLLSLKSGVGVFRITPDPRFFGYSYLVFPNRTDNPSMNHVDLPLDIGTSVYCLTSYISVSSFVLLRNGTVVAHMYRQLICCAFHITIITMTDLTRKVIFSYSSI